MIYEFFRWLAIFTGFPTYWVFFKRKTYYEDKEDYKKHKKSGAMIISNHYNMLDFILNMFLVLPRKLYIVASEFAFHNKLIAFGMRFFGGIQADRNKKSLRFIDESVSLIKKGKLVQIFPEGHNTPDGEIKGFRPSYIMIALRADSVIIPIVTDGNYHIFKRTHVIVGKAIYLSEYGLSESSSKSEILTANEQIRDRVIALRKKLDELK